MTLCLSIASGAITGFLTSKMPLPARQFDDTYTFTHVKYGDEMAEYDETPSEHKESE